MAMAPGLAGQRQGTRLIFGIVFFQPGALGGQEEMGWAVRMYLYNYIYIYAHRYKSLGILSSRTFLKGSGTGLGLGSNLLSFGGLSTFSDSGNGSVGCVYI